MRKEVKVLALIAILVGVAAVLGAGYYRDSVQGVRRPAAGSDNTLVRPDSPALGPADAPVTVAAATEFGWKGMYLTTSLILPG